MSQTALAERLSVKQSFLSSVENGRRPLPLDKYDLILRIFGIEDPEPYMLDIPDASDALVGEGEMLTRMLSVFHAQAHREIDNAHKALQARIDLLESRNAELKRRNAGLVAEVETLKARIEALTAGEESGQS